MPVNELTALYINILLSAFSADFNYFVVDDRNAFRPAGIGRWARSKGGSLHDDPRDGRFMTVSFLESWLFEIAAVEQGAMIRRARTSEEASRIIDPPGPNPHRTGSKAHTAETAGSPSPERNSDHGCPLIAINQSWRTN